MNKADLVNSVAESAKVTKADATKAIEAIVKTIQKSLVKGEKVTLVGFGTFGVNKRKARVGRNPKTGKSINIPAKKVVKFKAGSSLSQTVNNK